MKLKWEVDPEYPDELWWSAELPGPKAIQVVFDLDSIGYDNGKYGLWINVNFSEDDDVTLSLYKCVEANDAAKAKSKSIRQVKKLLSYLSTEALKWPEE